METVDENRVAFFTLLKKIDNLIEAWYANLPLQQSAKDQMDNYLADLKNLSSQLTKCSDALTFRVLTDTTTKYVSGLKDALEDEDALE